MVFISSDIYTFKLDRREKLGMITPIWTGEHPVDPGWTSFHLKLARNEQELVKHVEDIKPSLLLFLRKLRSLKIEVTSKKTKKTIQINRRETVDPDIVMLERLLLNGTRVSERYLILKHTITPDQKEPKRKGIKSSEIVLAFPITPEGTPIAETREVHAFLPLRNYGFNVCFPFRFCCLPFVK